MITQDEIAKDVAKKIVNEFKEILPYIIIGYLKIGELEIVKRKR